MQRYLPLSDRTNQAHNFDNIVGFGKDVRAAHSTVSFTVQGPQVPPSYSATMSRAALVSQPQRAAPLRVNDPYSAVVLTEALYPRSTESSPAQSLDVSRESVASTTPIIVKTPVRRIYRNGRPVPVYTSEHTPCPASDDE